MYGSHFLSSSYLPPYLGPLYTQGEGYDQVNYEGPWFSSNGHITSMVCQDLR